jgi:hypothetical protein
MNPLFETNTETYKTHPRPYNPEFSRILTAAVINIRFRKKLLENPLAAIDAGYGSEHFHLSSRDRSLIAAIRAKTLDEFASQLLRMREKAPIAMPIAAGG